MDGGAPPEPAVVVAVAFAAAVCYLAVFAGCILAAVGECRPAVRGDGAGDPLGGPADIEMRDMSAAAAYAGNDPPREGPAAV